MPIHCIRRHYNRLADHRIYIDMDLTDPWSENMRIERQDKQWIYPDIDLYPEDKVSFVDRMKHGFKKLFKRK